MSAHRLRYINYPHELVCVEVLPIRSWVPVQNSFLITVTPSAGQRLRRPVGQREYVRCEPSLHEREGCAKYIAGCVLCRQLYAHDL